MIIITQAWMIAERKSQLTDERIEIIEKHTGDIEKETKNDIHDKVKASNSVTASFKNIKVSI